MLQQLIARKRPIISLEVGLAFGVSALFICEALSAAGGKRHIIIDPVQDSGWKRIGLQNLERAGFGSLIDFRQEESQVALPQLQGEGVGIDFAFVDGWHTFDHALVDFFYVDRLLRPGGIVAFDDAQFPGVHKVCRYIAANRAYRVCGVLGRVRPARMPARLMRWAARHSKKLRRVVQDRFVQPDETLGFSWDSRLVAFEKIANDNRTWDFDRDF